MSSKTFFRYILMFFLTFFLVSAYAFFNAPKPSNAIVLATGFYTPAFYSNAAFFRYEKNFSTTQASHPGWKCYEKASFIQSGKLP